MTGRWADVWLASGSTDDRKCGLASSCCVFSNLWLISMLQHLFQFLAYCTTLTIPGLDCCTVTICCRPKSACNTGLPDKRLEKSSCSVMIISS